MKILRAQMGIALEHLPIAVTCNKGNLFDGESGLKEPAGGFMPKVVKAKVIDPQLTTCTPKSRTD